MTRFTLGQRVLVRIVDVGSGLIGFQSPRPGTVVSLRRCDSGAWIDLDQRDVLAGVHPFPEGDPRATHTMTYPEYCDPLSKSIERRRSVMGSGRD